MASIINAATSGGLISTADTSGVLALQTAGTTAVTVDASQNVGVGVAVPTKDVEVSGELRVQVSATGGTGVGIETFVSGANAYLTSYNRTTSAYAPLLLIGSTLGITGDTTVSGTLKGSATISVGSATPSSSGAGITFPASQSASSDANTLDDYEEGTWTPSIGGTATYNVADGNYVKVGKMVTVNADIWIASIGTGSAGTISGLPFTKASGYNQGCYTYYWNALSVSITNLYPHILTTTVLFHTVGAAATGVNNTVNIFQNNARVQFTAVYYI